MMVAAIARLETWLEFGFPDEHDDDLRALLTSHAALVAENAALREAAKVLGEALAGETDTRP